MRSFCTALEGAVALLINAADADNASLVDTEKGERVRTVDDGFQTRLMDAMYSAGGWDTAVVEGVYFAFLGEFGFDHDKFTQIVRGQKLAKGSFNIDAMPPLSASALDKAATQAIDAHRSNLVALLTDILEEDALAPASAASIDRARLMVGSARDSNMVRLKAVVDSARAEALEVEVQTIFDGLVGDGVPLRGSAAVEATMDAAAARGAEALRGKIASLLPAGGVQDELERYAHEAHTVVAQAVADNDARVTRHREETLAAVNAAFTEAWGTFTQANEGGEGEDDTLDAIHPDTVLAKGREAHSLAAAAITEGLGGGIVGEKELNADLLRMKEAIRVAVAAFEEANEGRIQVKVVHVRLTAVTTLLSNVGDRSVEQVCY